MGKHLQRTASVQRRKVKGGHVAPRQNIMTDLYERCFFNVVAVDRNFDSVNNLDVSKCFLY